MENRYDDYPHPRSPFAPWILAAFSAAIFSAVTLASAIGPVAL